MSFIKYFLLAIISIVLITFCAVNREAVSISLFPLPYSADLPIFIFALLCVTVGVIIGGLSLNIKLIKTKCQLKQSKRRIEALGNENKILRCERDHTQQLALTKQKP